MFFSSSNYLRHVERLLHQKHRMDHSRKPSPLKVAVGGDMFG